MMDVDSVLVHCARLSLQQARGVVTDTVNGRADDSAVLAYTAARVASTGGPNSSPWLVELWARAQRWRDARGITIAEPPDATTPAELAALYRDMPPVLLVEHCLHPTGRSTAAIRRLAADIVLNDPAVLDTKAGHERVAAEILAAATDPQRSA